MQTMSIFHVPVHTIEFRRIGKMLQFASELHSFQDTLSQREKEMLRGVLLYMFFYDYDLYLCYF